MAQEGTALLVVAIAHLAADASLWAGMTLAVPGATGFVALAQRAVIVMSGSCHRPGSGTPCTPSLARAVSGGTCAGLLPVYPPALFTGTGTLYDTPTSTARLPSAPVERGMTQGGEPDGVCGKGPPGHSPVTIPARGGLIRTRSDAGVGTRARLDPPHQHPQSQF